MVESEAKTVASAVSEAESADSKCCGSRQPNPVPSAAKAAATLCDGADVADCRCLTKTSGNILVSFAGKIGLYAATGVELSLSRTHVARGGREKTQNAQKTLRNKGNLHETAMSTAATPSLSSHDCLTECSSRRGKGGGGRARQVRRPAAAAGRSEGRGGESATTWRCGGGRAQGRLLRRLHVPPSLRLSSRRTTLCNERSERLAFPYCRDRP